ncbi:hypothetical protein GGI14_004722, partial [Coemansia sp. S680]
IAAAAHAKRVAEAEAANAGDAAKEEPAPLIELEDDEEAKPEDEEAAKPEEVAA